MKIQCPHCREIVEMEDFFTSDAGLSIRCGKCSASTFLNNPQSKQMASATTKSIDPGLPVLPQATVANGAEAAKGDLEILCPKCGHSQKDPLACHRCGLMFDKFDRSRLPPDPPEGVALWLEIQTQADDPTLHESFIKTCIQLDRLDYAAKQYRLLMRDPSKKQLAEQMLSKMLALSQAKIAPMLPAGSSTRDPKKAGKILWWILLALGGGALIVYAITLSNQIAKMGK